MRSITTIKVLLFQAFALILVGVAAGFFPVPVDQASYEATMQEIDSARGGHQYIIADETERLAFLQDKTSQKPQLYDVIKSIAWRPWIAIISTFLVMCIWRRIDATVLIATGVFSLALLIAGLQYTAGSSLIGFAMYAVIYFIRSRSRPQKS